MAITKSSFLTFTIILMAFLPPFAQSSRLRFQGEERVETVDERLKIIAKIKGFDHVKSFVGPKFEGGDQSGVPAGLDSSARLVPTGPNPLHHHNHDPVRP